MSPEAAPHPRDFLSGEGGQLVGARRRSRAAALDLLAEWLALARMQGVRLRRAQSGTPRRRVLALTVRCQDDPDILAAAQRELRSSRHEVALRDIEVGDRGKFENLNLLLEAEHVADYDWLLVLDDDVRLPRGFLDAFLFLSERFRFTMSQPAHRAASHAAWRVTRRRLGAVARQTRLVEIGPVFALSADALETLVPFPELRYGWGLDLHWSALAQARGWRQGVIDATPVQHGTRPIAAAYSREAAIAEACAFLASRPFSTSSTAQKTLALHRSW